jgi:hypothetical protein
MKGARGSKTANSLSEHEECHWKHYFYPFNFDTIGGILIHWLLCHTVFWEPKELWNTSNAGTRLNPQALLLQLKRNNFTSVSIQGRTWTISPIASSHVSVTVNEAGSNFASTNFLSFQWLHVIEKQEHVKVFATSSMCTLQRLSSIHPGYVPLLTLSSQSSLFPMDPFSSGGNPTTSCLLATHITIRLHSD